MASSDFWRDIANEFRNVPEAFSLTAIWSNSEKTGTGKWKLAGSKAAKYSFGALAPRGTQRL